MKLVYSKVNVIQAVDGGDDGDDDDVASPSLACLVQSLSCRPQSMLRAARRRSSPVPRLFHVQGSLNGFGCRAGGLLKAYTVITLRTS